MTAWIRIAASILVAATLTACGTDGGGGEAAREPTTDLPRALAVHEAAVADASAGFGLELAARIAALDSRPNIVLSPLSASMALGMAMNGASGATFEEMRSALGFGGLTQEQINTAYRGLIDLLAGLDPDIRLEIANAVWANEDVPFHEAFLEAVTGAFGARAESVSFADPTTPAAINEWVAEHTNGRIERIVDVLDPSLVMLLVNAVYFEGAWTTQFDPANTRPGAFRREDGSEVEVDMMSLGNVEVLRARGASYTAVELPYGNESFAAVIVLPDPGVGARDVLAGLDAEEWSSVLERLAPDRLDLLSIPKFTLTFDAYLNDALKAMGMERAFGPDADFTRMSPLGRQMCIDFVRQKTLIELDERGTRAAAATSVGVGILSFNGFVADRPFVFVIRERRSGAVLFVGLVGDPAGEDPGPAPIVSDCTGNVLP